MKRTIDISNQLRLLLFTVTVTLMIACTDEAADNIEIVRPLEVSNLTRSALRSSEAPTGTTEVTQLGTTIQALLMTKTERYQAGQFRLTDKGWSSSLYAKSNANDVNGTTYYLYGFMPSDIGNYSYSQKDMFSDYSTGAVLNFNTSPVSLKDICVITGVSYSETEAGPGAPALGNFAITIKPATHHNLKIRADHIFAGVKFTMKVAAVDNKNHYNDLRKIHLKSLELHAGGYGDVIRIPITAKSSTPIGAISLTPDENADKSVALLSDEDAEIVLTTSSLQIGPTAYFVPAAIEKLTLVSTYDIYNHDDTEVIRENCVSTNQLKKVLEGLKRGEQTTVNLTVKPTYLYVLSDDDAEVTFTID